VTNYRSRRRRNSLLGAVSIGLVVAVIGVGTIATDTLGAGDLYGRALAKVDRFLAGPVPDRSAPATVRVTDPPELDGDEGVLVEPEDSAGPDPTAQVSPSGAASSPGAVSSPDAGSSPGVGPAATPPPKPDRVPVDVDIVKNPNKVFAHEIQDTWCSSAGVQMTLAVLGLVDTSHEQQAEIQGRVRRWESYKDSHNGNWGPSAMSLALDAYGASGYEVRAYDSRQGAMRGAARAIQETNSPAILLTWRGAHTWIMTGFRADADPSVFGNAKIEGAYILDPWYPDISSIWGPSDPPGTFQDASELIRNYLPWKRPEGLYADRDGLFVAVIPTIRVDR
jgi:hypothetical protein